MIELGDIFLRFVRKQLVVADLLGSQQRRRLAEVTGEQRHLLEVGVLCERRKMAHLHVLGHTEAEWCQGKASLRDRMEWAAGSESMVSQRELTGKRREPRMDGKRGNLTTEGALPYRRISNAAKRFSPKSHYVNLLSRL